MPLNIRSEEVNRLAGEMTALAKVSKAAAVRIALVNEVKRLEGDASPLSGCGRFKTP
jgi:hypothetical protein